MHFFNCLISSIVSCWQRSDLIKSFSEPYYSILKLPAEVLLREHIVRVFPSGGSSGRKRSTAFSSFTRRPRGRASAKRCRKRHNERPATQTAHRGTRLLRPLLLRIIRSFHSYKGNYAIPFGASFGQFRNGRLGQAACQSTTEIFKRSRLHSTSRDFHSGGTYIAVMHKKNEKKRKTGFSGAHVSLARRSKRMKINSGDGAGGGSRRA